MNELNECLNEFSDAYKAMYHCIREAVDHFVCDLRSDQDHDLVFFQKIDFRSDHDLQIN